MQGVVRRWLDLAWDVGPILALFIGAMLTADLGDGRASFAIVQVILLLPLAFRRRWPLGALAATAVLAVATATYLQTPWISIVAVAVASFSAGDGPGDRSRAALAAIGIAGLMTVGLLALEADVFEALVFPFAAIMPAWLLGDVVRTRRLDRHARAEAVARTLRETEERIAAAAAEERRHMARELHDVVAHGVSVMLIQAGAARQVLETSPERATEAMLNVESTGRAAMAELRRLLGVLNDEGESTGLAPQPGISQLGPLVDRVREAGLPAELEIDGTPLALPASLDVTAYRIVQEALTNALRYARRARTLVHVTYDDAMLRVEILDDGPAADAAAGDGSGRGLVGMRQRATAVGGQLEAGPRVGGGYAVRAWLPMEPRPG